MAYTQPSEELTQVLNLLQQQQAEIATLREHLAGQTAKIERLEAGASPTPTPTEPQTTPTSRRRMLKKLGAAAAATLAATTALATTSQTASADANVTVGGASTPNYGIMASPDTATKPSTYSGTTGVIGISDSLPAISVTPVVAGVAGYSTGGVGIYGESSTFIGARFKGLQAAMVLEAPTPNPPATIGHLPGELYVSSEGSSNVGGVNDQKRTLYFCTRRIDTGGNDTETWYKIAGVGTVSSNYTVLPAPRRIVDSVNPTGLNPTGGQITGFGSPNPISNVTNNTKTYQATGTGGAPNGALAITGNLHVYSGTKNLSLRPGFGYLTVWQTGTNYPTATPTEGVATVWFARGGLASTAFTVLLDGNGQFNVAADSTTHVVIELTGYYL